MKAGDTFRKTISSPGVDQNRHLWIVLSDPVKYPDQLITVFVTSFQPRRDQTCVLEAGDHPFVTHKSIIAYSACETRKYSDIMELHIKKEIFMSDSFDIKLIERIRMLLEYSPHTQQRIKDVAKKQDFDKQFSG